MVHHVPKSTSAQEITPILVTYVLVSTFICRILCAYFSIARYFRVISFKWLVNNNIRVTMLGIRLIFSRLILFLMNNID